MEISSISTATMGIKPTADVSVQPQQVQQSVPSPQVTVQTVNAVPQTSEADTSAAARRSADTRGGPEQNVNTDVMERAARGNSRMDGLRRGDTSSDVRGQDDASRAEAGRRAGNPADEVARQAERERLQGAVDQIAQHIGQKPGSLQFSVDEELGRVIVKIVDTETQDVIKQIPSEEAVALAKSLSKMTGMLLSTKA